jgi:hypothetical protein
MIACYDLARCPPTYDVVAFLALAELERVRQGADHLDIHILPGPASGFRRDSLWPRTVEERIILREHVLVPLCHLLPSAKTVSVSPVRYGYSTSSFGVDAYHISLPAIMKALKQGCRPLRGEPAPKRPKLITFTLREAEHHSPRNSRVGAWLEAALELEARGYEVQVVRDSWKASQLLPVILRTEQTPARSAALKITERAFLYGRAALNVGICNGPMWMSIFMDAPTLMLRPTTNLAGGCYDDQFYAKFGLPRGSQLPTSPPHQRLVWEEDTCENIVRAVEEMLAVVA